MNAIRDIQASLLVAKARCDKRYQIANQPLAYNEAGSLLISFIELWRALDSNLYQASSASNPIAGLVRAQIPLVVARQQRYFFNSDRLRVVPNDAEGPRYLWNYLDYLTPSLDTDKQKQMNGDYTHIEDTSHSNFDMSYVNVVRKNFDRLNAVTTFAGEPIVLDDGILRRFANTFLQKLALPAEIDAGKDVRCRVDGDKSCPKTVDTPQANNRFTDGWVHLAEVDPTVYRLVSDVVQRGSIDAEGHPGQHELSIANHSALLTNKRYSTEVNFTDITAAAGSRPAAGDPFGWVYAAQDVQDVTFRGTDGYVYELWRTVAGTTGYTNLSAIAHAPGVIGNPKGYDFPSLGAHNVVYRGTDRRLHVLWWTNGGVGHDDLTTLSGAPRPAGDPFPYVSPPPYINPPLGVQNVVYRGVDGNLHVLYWADGAVGHDDITRASGAPKPAGDPFGYFITNQGIQNVVYRGKDWHLHGLYWGLGAVGHDDLTTATGAPLPVNDPTAYVTPEGLQNVVYLGSNGHIYGIYWTGTGAAQYEDLSAAASGAPLPATASNPEAYFSVDDQTHHIIYTTSNGHLHELSWTGSNAVSHADLTTLAPAVPPAARPSPAYFYMESENIPTGKLSAYVFAPDKTQHLIYRAGNRHLIDLNWKTPEPDIIILRAMRAQ